MYPLHSPFLHYDPSHLSATSPSTTPSSFVVPSQQSAPACVRSWGHRPILWALTDDPTTRKDPIHLSKVGCRSWGVKTQKKKRCAVVWMYRCFGWITWMDFSKKCCTVYVFKGVKYISFRFSYDECIGLKFDMTCYSHRSLTIHPLKA